MKRRALSLALAMVGVAISGRASANDVKLTYTLADLAQKKIAISAQDQAKLFQVVPGKVAIGQCSLNIGQQAITPLSKDLKTCAALWLNQALQDELDLGDGGGKLQVRLKLAPKDNYANAKDLKEGTLKLAAKPNIFGCDACTTVGFDYKLWVFIENEGWKEITKQEKGFDLPKELFPDAATNRDGKTVVGYTNFNEQGQGGLFKFELKPEPSPPQGDKLCQPSALQENFCPTPSDANEYQVCFDLVTKGGVGNEPIKLSPAINQQIILPNRKVRVKVLHETNVEIKIEMQGDRGIFQPKTQIYLPSDGKTESATPLKCPDFRISEESFSSRIPGKPADIVVKATGPDGKERQYKVELLVQETYFGAIRLGAALVFNGATDYSYAAQQMPGSEQAQVMATSHGNINSELVLGFSPYLFDYWKTGEGRPAVRGTCTFPCGLAPYFGIGVLNAKADGFELLKSVHLGLEYEFVPSFSLAATVAARRVTRLASGISVGSPVSDTVPTTTGFGVGFGLVLNFSPEFLKIAASSGAAK